MATVEIKLPEIGEGVTEGELVNWLVAVGDSIEVDQPIAEIMTDKATVEIPSSTAGTVKELKVEEGDVVPVDEVILVLDANSAGASPVKEEKKEEVKPAAPVAAASPAPAIATSNGTSIVPPVAESAVLATPSTRRLAREMNVDINAVSGTGLAGRVTREDVLSQNGTTKATNSVITPVAPSANIPRPAYRGQQGAIEERVKLKGIRRKIAENMQLYKQIIPHFSLMDEANVTRLYKMRNDLKKEAERLNVKITYLPFVMKALIATMREFPMMNASIDDAAQEIVYKRNYNIGFAADTPNGLVVPVIKDADQKSILEISAEITELATKARAGKLSLDEMSGATITITNIGSVGGSYATPIINHPEVAIIGMYKITDKPILKDGKWRAIKSMNLSCTADHRLIDGAVAARFLTAMIKRLENPARLMLDMF